VRNLFKIAILGTIIMKRLCRIKKITLIINLKKNNLLSIITPTAKEYLLSIICVLKVLIIPLFKNKCNDYFVLI